MNIDVYQTYTEADGTITAYVRFSDEATGKVLKDTCIQGKAQADFETKIGEYLNKVETEGSKKSSDMAMISSAISETQKRRI